MKYIRKTIEKIKGRKCIAIRLTEDYEIWEELIAIIYPKPYARSEGYVCEVKGRDSVVLWTNLQSAIDTIILKAIEANCGILFEEENGFEDKSWKMQVNSSGFRADLRREQKNDLELIKSIKSA